MIKIIIAILLIIVLIIVLILNKKRKIKLINNQLNIIENKIESNLIEEADILKNYLIFFNEKEIIDINEYNHYLDYINNNSIYEYYDYIVKFNEEIKNVLDNREKLIYEPKIKELNKEKLESDIKINANIKLYNEINNEIKKENKKILTKIVNKIIKTNNKENFTIIENKELNILKDTN